MDISFIILNYKSEDYLKRCIRSIAPNMPGIDHEVIVVNNDEESLENMDAEKVRIINNARNGGYAKGCNAGSKTARGNVLFFLNADTEILTSNIAEFLEVFADKTVGAAAPRLLTPEGKTQEWSAGYDITFFETIRNNVGKIRSKTLWEKDETCSVDWASGAALAISRDVFASCGGFDENFFMYFEDVDLCRRIRQAGFGIMLVPNFKVLHLGGKSYPDTSRQKKHYYESQDYYFKKHFGGIVAFFLQFLRSVALFLKTKQP